MEESLNISFQQEQSLVAKKPEKKKRIKKQSKEVATLAVQKQEKQQILSQLDAADAAMHQRLSQIQLPDFVRMFLLKELRQTVPVVKELLPEYKFLLFGEIPLDLDFFINKMKVRKVNSNQSGILDKFRGVRKSLRMKDRMEFDLDGSKQALSDFQYIIEAVRSINHDIAHSFAQQLENYQDIVRRILARNSYYRQILKKTDLDMETRLKESLKKADEILESLNPEKEIFIYNVISKQFGGMITLKKGYSRGLISNLGVSDDEFERAVRENKVCASMMDQVNHSSIIYSQQKMQENPYLRMKEHEIKKFLHPNLANHHSRQFQSILRNLLKEAISKQDIVSEFLSRQGEPSMLQRRKITNNPNQSQEFPSEKEEFVPNPLPSFSQYQKFIKNINLHPHKFRFPPHKQIELFKNITQILTKKSSIPQSQGLSFPTFKLASEESSEMQVEASNFPEDQQPDLNSSQSMPYFQTISEKQINLQESLFQQNPINLFKLNTNNSSSDDEPFPFNSIQRNQSFDISEYRKKQDNIEMEEDSDKRGFHSFIQDETSKNLNDSAISVLFQEFNQISNAIGFSNKFESQEPPILQDMFDSNLKNDNPLSKEDENVSLFTRDQEQKVIKLVDEQIDDSQTNISIDRQQQENQLQNLQQFKNQEQFQEKEVEYVIQDGECSPGETRTYQELQKLNNQHHFQSHFYGQDHHHHHHDHHLDDLKEQDSSSSTNQIKIKDFYEQLLQYIGNDEEDSGIFPFPNLNFSFKEEIIKEYEQIRSVLDDNQFMDPQQFDNFLTDILKQPRIKKKQYLKHLMKIPDSEDYYKKQQLKKEQKKIIKSRENSIGLSTLFTSEASKSNTSERNSVEQEEQMKFIPFSIDENSNVLSQNETHSEEQQCPFSQIQSLYNNTQLPIELKNNIQYYNHNVKYNNSDEHNHSQYSCEQELLPNGGISQKFMMNNNDQNVSHNCFTDQYNKAAQSNVLSQCTMNSEKKFMEPIYNQLTNANVSNQNQSRNNFEENNDNSNGSNENIPHHPFPSHPFPNIGVLVPLVREYFKADSFSTEEELLDNIKQTLSDVIQKGLINQKIIEFLQQEGNLAKATEVIGCILTERDVLDGFFKRPKSFNPHVNGMKMQFHNRKNEVIKKVYELNSNLSFDDEININEYLEVFYIGKTKLWKDFSKDFILNNSFRDIKIEIEKLSQNEFLKKYYPNSLDKSIQKLKNGGINLDIQKDNSNADCDTPCFFQNSFNNGYVVESQTQNSQASNEKKIDLNLLESIIKQLKMGPPHPFKILLGMKKGLQKIVKHFPKHQISQPFLKNTLKMVVFFFQGDSDNYIKCRKRVPIEAIDQIEKTVIKKLCQIPIV